MQYSYVESPARLRDIYGATEDLAVRKCLDHIDVHARSFIAASPFLVLASMNANGQADSSPRGDLPGFVEVLSKHHLLLPDRPGNNRLDTLENIIANPSVGLLFLIPGVRETLRVNGNARITDDAALLAKHAIEGRAPKTGMIIKVEEMFLHCAKALMRSQLWKPETWPAKGVVASPGRIWSDHLKGSLDADALDKSLESSMPKNLW